MWQAWNMTEDLTPQQIVAWARSRSKWYTDIADQIERDSGLISKARRSVVGPTTETNGTSNRDITLAELETSVREKSGRVQDLAVRLGTTAFRIGTLLGDPASKVYRAERGWLKVRQ